MRTEIEILISIFFGVILTHFGFPFYTWQFWVISIPTIITYLWLKDKFSRKDKINKND